MVTIEELDPELPHSEKLLILSSIARQVRKHARGGQAGGDGRGMRQERKSTQRRNERGGNWGKIEGGNGNASPQRGKLVVA